MKPKATIQDVQAAIEAKRKTLGDSTEPIKPRESIPKRKPPSRDYEYAAPVTPERSAYPIEAYLRMWGFGERHMREDIDRSTRWGGRADELARRAGEGFIIALLGKRGTGKTQMAAYLAKCAHYEKRKPKYVKAMALFLDIRRSYGPDAEETESEVVQRYTKPDLLIIDELQERGDSEWEDRVLTHIIDVRYDGMRDTLLLGNLTADELPRAVGPSITSRLRECGGVIECDWESFRK